MKTPCIAVIDDDPAILDMTELLLALDGYQPTCFSTMPHDLTCLDGLQPDMIILDLHLEQPEAGLGVIEALRRNPATAHIPIVLWSADSNVEAIVARRHLQEDVVVLLKPVLPTDLLRMVAELAATP